MRPVTGALFFLRGNISKTGVVAPILLFLLSVHARIKEIRVLDDGSLHVLLDELWGCNLEIWFWGDVEYCTVSMEDNVAPFWQCGSVRIQDGFIYLVDDFLGTG